MIEKLEFARELIDFIYESPTAFHAVHTVKERLHNCGFKEVQEDKTWNLKKGGKYYEIYKTQFKDFINSEKRNEEVS